MRDRLIADQENLLNTYRCLFGVDVGVVPGGCPNPYVVSPAAAPQNPTQHDLDVRDGLIQRQEALLNVYRCRFGVDVEVVVGGCPDGGAPQQSGHCARGSQDPARVSSDYAYYDVHPDYYDEAEQRWAGSLFDGVNRLCELGVFEGTDCGENLFCPFDPVDGATLAIWLVRVLDEDSGGPGDAVGRLVELGVAQRCGSRFAGLCPGEGVSRAELATFVSRALDLPESEPASFWDVDKNSPHSQHINRLFASRIDEGCGGANFTPFDFCPDQLAQRGAVAELLSEVLDYIEAGKLIKVNEGSGTDNSIGLSISFSGSTR